MVEPAKIVRLLLIAPAVVLGACGSSMTEADPTAGTLEVAPPAPVVFGASVSGDCFRLFELASGSDGELACPDVSGLTRPQPLEIYGARVAGSVTGSLFRMGPGYRFESIAPATDMRVAVIDDEWLLVEGPATNPLVIRVQSDGTVLACEVGLATLCGPDRSP
jgi:hypothetical protein